MIKNNILNVIICMWLFALSSWSGRDHAALFGPKERPRDLDKFLHKLGVDREDYRHHVMAAEEFKDKHFRDEKTKHITLEKTKNFLLYLNNQYFALKNRAYETKFLEQLDVAKTSSKKSQTEAIKPQNSSNVLLPFEVYLIPKIKLMIKEIKQGKNNDHLEGLLDDFIRGYIPYYNPNPFNSRYKTKINVVGGIYHVPKHQERKIDTDKVQANNLVVKNQEEECEINEILKGRKNPVMVGDYLTNDDILALLDNDFDISKLDPGESPFWEVLTPQEKKKIFYRDPRIFPLEDSKIIFDRVLYGGANSAKVRIKYKNQYGNLIAAKLKVGSEVASELASGALMRLLGFNADKMIYTGSVKIYLKNRSFENFEAELRQKFGQWQNARYNYERGVDDNGERYIVWRDTLVEARPPEELRVGPLDTASWDLQNRREYRASTLALAWLGINDLKTDNKKALLVKKGQAWVVEHRIHDTGIALGPTFTITGIESILNLPAPYAKANQFETKIVKNIQGGVEIVWNDFCFQYRFYGSGTYYDHKWMARKIAALSKNDIALSVIKSGLPPDLAHLFIVKLLMRRNNIVRTYNLLDEYELFDEPKDITKYSPEAYPDIKNGAIDKTAYENKNIIPIRVRTWGSLLSTLIATPSLPFGDMGQSMSSNGHTLKGTLAGGALKLDYGFGKEAVNVGPFGKLYILPGITMIPVRNVLENPQNLNTLAVDKHHQPKKDRHGELKRTHLPYMVVDQVKITIAVGLGASEFEHFPLFGGGSINVVQKTLTHRHFAETIKGAWTSPFKIPQIIKDGKKPFAARHLGDLETIEWHYAVGFNANIQFGVNWATSIAENGITLAINAQKIGNKMIYRDQYGRLHYVREQVKKTGANASFGFLYGNVKVFDYSGLGLQLGAQKMAGVLEDYLIGVNDPIALQTNDHEPLTKEKSDAEIKAFHDLKKDPAHAKVMLNFSRDATAIKKQNALSLLFLWSHSTVKTKGEVKDTLVNGETRQLFHSSIYSGKYLGKKLLLGTEEVTDLTVLHGKSKKTIIEVEKRAPNKFTIFVSNRVFSRKTDREGLLEIIKKLNARFSAHPTADLSEQFFADLHLPEKTEQNKYRKIYADMRVQVDGEYLLNLIQNIDENDVKAMIQEFFAHDAIGIRNALWSYDGDGKWQEDADDYSPKTKLVNSTISARKQHKILTRFRLLKKELEHNQLDWQIIWTMSRDLVHQLFSKYYGLHILRGFLNIKNNGQKDRAILVYGEIRNIGDHVETLERPHGHHANMRETGAHWGNYEYGKDKVRPIQYYLKFEDPTNQLPIYWAWNLQSNVILGNLEKGQPPNYSGEGI